MSPTYSWDQPSGGTGYSWSNPPKPNLTQANVQKMADQLAHQGTGGGGGLLGNLAGQVESTIHGIPTAVATAAGATYHDLTGGKTKDPYLQDWRKVLFDSPGQVFRHYLHDPTTFGGRVLEPQIQQISGDVGALRRGDWHYFQQHPLNPIIDIAAIASLGGKGGLGLAKAGKLGEGASTIANSERLLKVGEHTEPLGQSRTLQGRYRQQAFDKLSMQHPDLAIVGANARMQKILNRRVASMTVRARLPVREFQRLTDGLTPAEVFSFHVAAEGVPLSDRIAYYQAQLAEAGAKTPTKTVTEYLTQLMSPEVKDVLDNPRPEFVAAVEGGKALEARAGERLVKTDQLAAETRPERAALPQEAMLGAAHRAEHPESAAVFPPSLEQNLVNPAFPAPFRFPHVAKKGTAGLYTNPKVEGMLGKAKPLDQLRHNAGVRMRNAMMLTDPTQVLSTDYLQTMRHETILQMQKEALDPISQPLEAGLPGFKREGEFYYRPSYDRKTTAPVRRDVREQQALAQDRSAFNPEADRVGADRAVKGIVSTNLRDLVDGRDLHNLEKLNELGIRRVPAAFGKDFSKEFGGTHWALRYFYDKPFDVWRALTLNFSPRWLVNNFVGNAVFGLARYGPAGAAAYLRVLLAQKDGWRTVLKLRNWTRGHPKLERKYGAVFREVAPELHSAGLFGTQGKITHGGVYEGKLAGFLASPGVKQLDLIASHVTRGVLGVGRAITKAELLLAEDTGREAAFIRSAGGDVAKIRATAKKMGEGNLSLAEALKRLDRPSVEKAVRDLNDALGDFNDLSHTERTWVRRAIPFWTWYKVVTKVSGKYAARYPARVLLLKNIGEASDKTGEYPEWLRGSLLLGGEKNGVQSLLSTQGLNPYESLNQILHGDAGGMLNPLIAASVTALTGDEPAFGPGHKYYGPGDKTGGWTGLAERFGGSFGGNLAQARLYQQSTQPYQGSLYAPKTYNAGPVSINDYILQYLGLPLRHVNVAEARRERGLGR